MPQLACVSGSESKSKVACETAAPALFSGSDAGDRCGTVVSGVARVDDAAEPVFLRLGFVELFGAALRRDGSTKGNSNPKAAASKGAGAPRAGSRRMPAAVVVAVLPAGKVVAQERRRGWRRPAAGARVFASEAVGGAAEPVSPKVSCFGAVRSERRAAATERQAEERGGCWASVTAAVRRLCWRDSDPRVGEPAEANGSSSASTASTPDAVLSPPRPVTGLGDVKRLASRRWPETMAGEGPFGLASP
ncbi:hypothetical protein QOZ80_4AG0318500 [Eleusine coracana subsp. coracana]|nr:hypothetical protein QOZ80_4AG0318500 [Eleusine coracana subsp. coracana]